MYFGFIAFFLFVQYRIYQKMGRKGWEGLIPIYSLVVLVELIKKPTYWAILAFVPFINIYFMIVIINEQMKGFGKDSTWTVLYILFSPIVAPIIAFNNDIQWIGFEEDRIEEIDQIGQ